MANRYREPYSQGDDVAVFYVDDGVVRLRSERVEWINRTEHGFEVGVSGKRYTVDELGEGAYLAPLDDFLRAELADKGQGFEVPREDPLLQLPPPQHEHKHDEGWSR